MPTIDVNLLIAESYGYLRIAKKITVPLSPLPLGEGRVRGQKDTTVIFFVILTQNTVQIA